MKAIKLIYEYSDIHDNSLEIEFYSESNDYNEHITICGVVFEEEDLKNIIKKLKQLKNE